MRRRLLRLATVAVALPAAARAADVVAQRLEVARGPSTASRALRGAARVADRRAGRMGRIGPFGGGTRRRRRRV